MRDHRLKHLRRHDDGLVHGPRPADQVLLRDRHGLGRQLHAQVAARHHDAIRHLQNLIDGLQGLWLLDLGDHLRRLTGLGDQRLERNYVGRPPHERQRQKVHAQLEGETRILLVLVGQRRRGHDHAWQVHAFAIAQGAAVDDGLVAQLFQTTQSGQCAVFWMMKSCTLSR